MRQSVSVVVAAYNAAETLGATLSGILGQRYAGQVQAVVVDDGSVDSTLKIARAFAGQYRNEAGWLRQITVSSQANQGQSAARNHAFSEADGELIAICDADDILLPGYLESAVQALAGAAQEKCFVASNALVLTPAGIAPDRPLLREAPIPPDQQRLASLQNNIGSIFTVFPRQMLEEVGGFDEGLRSCEDWDLWLRASYAGWTMVRQNTPQAVYRWTTESVSSGTDAVYQAEDRVIRKLVDSTTARLSPAERQLAELRLDVGSPLRLVTRFENALRSGDLRDAKTALFELREVASFQRRLMAKVKIAGFPGGLRLLQLRQKQLDARNGYHLGMAR